MSLTCLTCRTVLDDAGEQSAGACPLCGEALVGSEGAWFEWTDPDGQRGVLTPFHGLTIGRVPSCDLVLRDREVSKVHARIFRRAEGYLVRDEASANGTRVNGQRVVERTLADGDTLILGSSELVYHAEDPPEHVGGITIVPQSESDDLIQASLKCEPGDFKPEADIGEVDELRADYERLRSAYRFQRYMGAERNPHALVRNILKLAFELLPADRGAILLREEEGAPLSPAVTLHRDGDGEDIVIPDSILRRAVREQVAVLSGDAQADLRFQEAVSIISANVRSAMCVPLVGEREVIGAIHLDTLEKTGAFSVKDLQLLSVLAGQAASVLERARLNARLDRESKVRERLARFMSPEVMREVLERGLDLDPEGRLARVTVMFCDVRGFTSLAESMPAADLLRMLNGFFERMVDVVFRHGGVLDKFIGDALMAVWGAPIQRPSDARRALEAGRDMLAEVADLSEAHRRAGWPELSVGIGLNSGEAVFGTVGSSRRMEYTVVGDVVNLASRVCDMARGQQLLITSATLDATAADGMRPPAVRGLPPVKVRGRRKPVRVYEVPLP